MNLIITLLLISLLSVVGSAQKLPNRFNKINEKQEREGEWVIYMNSLWQPTQDTAEVAYYRLITYHDDRPVGLVRDFYRNGEIQFEGVLVTDRPEESYDGVCTWFYNSGQIRIKESYKNGVALNDQRVLLRSGNEADEKYIDHYRRGMALSDQKKYAEAAEEFELVIENVEAFIGRESEDYASVADWLGITNTLAKKSDKAIYYDREFVSVRSLIHHQPDTLLLIKLSDLGSAYRIKKEWSVAERYFKEFLDLNSKYFKNNHPNFPDVLQSYGAVCEGLRKYDDALFYITEAEKIINTDPEKYKYLLISYITTKAGLYLSLGEMTKGEQFLSEKIKVLKSKYGEDSEYYTTALGLLARLRADAGQYKIAAQTWLGCLKICERTKGVESMEYASLLGSLGELYVALGDIPKADKYIQQARKIYENNHGDEESYLQFLIKLSGIYEVMGNTKAWKETLEKQRDLTARVFGKSSLPYAQVLTSETLLFFSAKDWEGVINLAAEAIAIFKKFQFSQLNEREKARLAQLHQIVSSAFLMKYYADADPADLSLAQNHAEESVRIVESFPDGENRSNRSEAYLTMAYVFEAKLEKAKADRYYAIVLRDTKKEFGENNFQLINLLFLIAKKSELRKDLKTSFEYYKKAIDQHRIYIQKVFPYLSESEREQFYEKNKLVLQSFYGFAAHYHHQIKGLTELWYDLVMQQKGIILQSFAPVRDAIFTSSNASAQAVFLDWQNTKNEYARLIQNNEADQNKISVLSERLNTLEKRLGEFSATLTTKLKSEVGWRDLQKSLLPNEAALEIIYTVADTEEGYDSSYYALMVKPAIAEPIIVKLQRAKDIEGRAIKYYRNAIQLQQEDLHSFDLFWKPLQNPLQDVKKIWLSSDGVYHKVNPSTFFNPLTKRYVQEDLIVQSVPSTYWVAMKRNNPILDKVTIFAHPTYGATTAALPTELTRSLDFDNVSDLPGTKRELEDMKTLFSKYNISFQAFEGEQASEEQLKKVGKPQILHIATHGYFLQQALNLDERSQNSLLRSGLLLADCQKKPHLADLKKEDGMLTAFEASTLPLFATELVVLSACETGLGDVKNGEGVYGLQRAFFMAGAQRLLMSLWKVDDEATEQFMISFYEEWIRSKNLDQSFQMAQQEVKEKYKQPFYWGAFILSGK